MIHNILQKIKNYKLKKNLVIIAWFFFFIRIDTDTRFQVDSNILDSREQKTFESIEIESNDLKQKSVDIIIETGSGKLFKVNKKKSVNLNDIILVKGDGKPTAPTEAYVEQYGRDLRLHVLDPDTKIIEGTLGKNMEANDGPSKMDGYHLYNERTGFNAFFDKSGRRYITGFETNQSQKEDLALNANMM